MKKYTIKYTGWNSLEEDLGDNVIFFNFEVSPPDAEPFELNFPYHIFKKYLKEMNPGVYQLLEKAEKQNRKWGPHESDYVRELESYGIDLGEFVIKIAPEIYNLQAEAERIAGLKANPPKLDKIIKELEELTPGVKENNQNYYRICNTLEKVITNEIVTLFPVLVNSSSEHIEKLGDILANHIPALANDLNQLIWEAQGL